MTVSYSAPGRVNLIGEHTDYNLGFALPIALPRRTVVTFTPEHTGAITARSDRADGSARIPLDTTPGQVTGWAAYAAGAIWALRGAGHPVPGGAMSITSDVEIGSGLSSSAALIGAVLGAVGAATGTRIDRLERARLAQRAENDYVGAPTGLLDHLAALFGAPKTALLIDFRDITVRPVAFDPDACDVVLLLMDSQPDTVTPAGSMRCAGRRVNGRPPIWGCPRCALCRIAGWRRWARSPIRSTRAAPGTC